ncbi:MAG: hypothetical protein IJ009_04565 [Clostridia bacterium]|nr:hypothetical protein [Clostridia bacterium]
MSKTILSFSGCSLWEMKRRLSQYKDLLREIDRDRLRLAQLAGRLAHINPAGLPQGVRIAAESLADYRDRIEENVVRCVELTRDIQDFINSIEESELRRVFTMRYINGYTWQKIAFGTGTYDESVPRKKHDRYLKMLFAKSAEHQ